MEEKKKMTVEELKNAYIQLKKDYDNIYSSMFKVYQSLTEDVNDLLYLIDYKKRTVHTNKRVKTVLGVPVHMDFMGKEYSLLDFVEEESKEEFLNMHRAIINGKAHEMKGIIRLRHANGMKVIYEHTIHAIYDDQGINTGVSLGQFHDVTERYVKNVKKERLNKLVVERVIFDFTYEIKMDRLIMKVPQKLQNKFGIKAQNIFFFSKLVKEEKVCPKADIPIMLDLLKNGTEAPVQISMFDTITEEYRWYEILGHKDTETIVGTVEDITNLKLDTEGERQWAKILEAMNDNFKMVFEINLQENIFEMLMLDPSEISDSIEKKGRYSDLHKLLVQNTKEEYRQARDAFGSIEHVKEKLASEKRIEFEYEIINHKHSKRRMVIQTIEEDKERKPKKAVCFQSIVGEEIGKSVENQQSGKNQGEQNESDQENNYVGRVLVAEDYELNAEYMMDVLGKANLMVEWVKNGKDAVNRVNEHHADYYSFILMDTKMPQMDGFEATSSIRKLTNCHGEDLPIIGLSIDDNDKILTMVHDSGMTEHMQKPIYAKQVNYLLRKYVNKE